MFYTSDFNLNRLHKILGIRWAASCEKIPNGLSRCHIVRSDKYFLKRRLSKSPPLNKMLFMPFLRGPFA